MPVRVGLIGFGVAGRAFHAPLFAAAGLDFRAAATSQPDALAQAYPGVAAVADAKSLCARDDIDLVVVATPNTSHAPMATLALEADKHVLVDKPFTISTAEADALVQLADRRERVLAVYQNRRYDGDFLLLRQEVAAGRLGRLVSLESHFERFRPTGLRGWRAAAGPGAGVLYDLGAHLLDQALVLFGWPRWLWADLASETGGAVDDAFCLRLGGDGWRATLYAGNLVADHRLRFALHGERGSLVTTGLDSQEAALKAGGGPTDPGFGVNAGAIGAHFTPAKGGDPEPLSVPHGAYADYYRDLVQAIETGSPPPASGRDGRRVIRLIEAAFRSNETGERVALPPAD